MKSSSNETLWGEHKSLQECPGSRHRGPDSFISCPLDEQNSSVLCCYSTIIVKENTKNSETMARSWFCPIVAVIKCSDKGNLRKKELKHKCWLMFQGAVHCGGEVEVAGDWCIWSDCAPEESNGYNCCSVCFPNLYNLGSQSRNSTTHSGWVFLARRTNQRDLEIDILDDSRFCQIICKPHRL